MKLLLYSVSALIWFLPLAEGLQCYYCSNVTSTDYCITNITCQQGQKCYTSTHGVGSSQTFNLGCKSENDCLPAGGGLNIVGRSTASQNNCFQCCQVDNCNHNLCSSGLQVISEVGQCEDDPTFDCAGVSSLLNLCMDVHHAKLKCRKYCGLCYLVDGSWSVWSSWSRCDVTCGSGHVARTRTCSNPSPAHGGLDCFGDSKEMTSCVLDTCPVHGGWSLWSPWGYCSVTCGIGLERRDRTCSNPYPSRDGESCHGDSRDDRSCFVKACADGLWSTWSNWGSCSATCLGGLQKRVRTCDNPAPTEFGHDCVGNSEEYQTCNNEECGSEGLQCFSCSNVTSTNDCNTNVTYQQGQKCYTSTHGVGTSQTFNLGCKYENECLPGQGNLNIVGRSTNTQPDCFNCCAVDNCNQHLCSSGLQVINEVSQCADDPIFNCDAVNSVINFCTDIHHAKLKCRKFCGLCNLVDGDWSVWSSWSRCDVTCGSGHMTHTRTCNDPAPAHGGLDCVGDNKEIISCSLDPCPVPGGWSLWSPWGYCSVTCGIGLERRDRSCSNPYPSHGGDSCYGDSRDDRPCFVKACADGLWSTWSNWGSCSTTCLVGLQKRVRTCDNPAPTEFGHDCVGNSEEYQTCNNKECRSDTLS